MKLVDTSAWVHALRRQGNPAIKARLTELVTLGQACWCPVVRLELWAGVGVDPERRVLRVFEQRIPELSITDDVWQLACDLADRSRRAGTTVPPNDLLIAACARHHGVEVEAADAHFEFLRKL
ncbi:MAG TPA: PIN domain-containing protein, partial [Bacteroidia bacterium]|nr:PIN domain-containing protein [Bacteroidia bacterium]